jgi:pimeloyl-ACP methyl ester carboxylesterase
MTRGEARRNRRAPRRAPYGLAETTTSVDGKPVHALTSGELQGPPELVFVPGLGAPGYLAPWARESATWTRATLLDLPGWRAGRPRSCAATLPGVASATAGWLQATDRHHVILLGHSTGAQAVLRTALQVPDRVTGVVLAGPTFDPAAHTLSALIRRARVSLMQGDLQERAEAERAWRAPGPGVAGGLSSCSSSVEGVERPAGLAR